ncbi:hypothetical protein HDU96_009882 [Phlyctochytrium bullatum]|nr:hypothetical protein HDU96_009882 [Phlyctochytrium bullatum]
MPSSLNTLPRELLEQICLWLDLDELASLLQTFSSLSSLIRNDLGFAIRHLCALGLQDSLTSTTTTTPSTLRRLGDAYCTALLIVRGFSLHSLALLCEDFSEVRKAFLRPAREGALEHLERWMVAALHSEDIAPQSYRAVMDLIVQMDSVAVADALLATTPVHQEIAHHFLVQVCIHGSPRLFLRLTTTLPHPPTLPFLAASHNHIHLLPHLLPPTADPNPRNAHHENYTPLHTAAANGNTEAVAWLLAHPRIDPDALANRNKHALHLAATFGHADILQMLLARSPTPDPRDVNNFTPLHAALSPDASPDPLPVLTVLLRAHADPTLRADDHHTPLHLAAANASSEACEMLLRCGAEVEAVTRGGWTPLHCAVFAGRRANARVLLGWGASPARKTRARKTPMRMAREYGGEEMVRVLEEFTGCGGAMGEEDELERRFSFL